MFYEIKGNRYTEEEINNMLSDYLVLGECYKKYGIQKAEYELDRFLNKYTKDSVYSLVKQKNRKHFLSSAKKLYTFAEHFLYSDRCEFEYYFSSLQKGSKVEIYYETKDKIVWVRTDSMTNFFERRFFEKGTGNIQFE